MFVKRATLTLLTGTAALCSIGSAHAAGTIAGTVISNTASVSYTVNGATQTTTSTTSTFVVDLKANFTVVVDQTGYTQVNLGQTAAVTSYRLTNTTNGTQDFLLDANQTFLSLGLPGTDNFDMLNLKVFVDVNGDGIYEPTIDTATYVDELAPDAHVEIFLVGDVPTTAGAQLAQVNLHATIAAGGAPGTKGAALVPSVSIANADNTVDVVFADDDDDGPLNLGDTANNGQGRAYSGYQVATSALNLTVTKTARVLSDGVSLTFPKAIPGATVEYCLTVTNSTLLTPANGVTLTDILPSAVTYVPGTLTYGAPGVPGVACNLLPTTIPDVTGYNGTTKTVTATIPSVAGGTSQAAAFQVTIN
jgi:uncharacterized repeat protein (TIGR01451 family)